MRDMSIEQSTSAVPDTLAYDAEGIRIKEGQFLYCRANFSWIPTATTWYIDAIYKIDGQQGLTLHREAITTRTDGWSEKIFSLTNGRLISLRYWTPATGLVHPSPFAGAAYILNNIDPTVAYRTRVLFQTLWSQNLSVSFPESPVEDLNQTRAYMTYEIASPAAGNNLTFTVPPSCWVRPVSFSFALVTDANVANRIAAVYYRGVAAGEFLGATVQHPPLAASSTRYYMNSITQFTIVQAASTYNASASIERLPDAVLSSYNNQQYRIDVQVTNIQAGDQLSQVRLTGEFGYSGAIGAI